MLSIVRMDGVSLIQSRANFSSLSGGRTMYLITGSVDPVEEGTAWLGAGDGVFSRLFTAVVLGVAATASERARSEATS